MASIHQNRAAIALCLLGLLSVFPPTALSDEEHEEKSEGNHKNTIKMINEGQRTFRHDTFGNEGFWGEQLRLHEAIAGAANGGVGPGVSPTTALALGLKVDVKALPKRLRKNIRKGRVNLHDPAVTLALLKLDAVVGVKGRFNEAGQIRSMGITCALCHTQVDDAFAAGIGHRLDGWANRDLNVGAIIAAAPDLSPFMTLLGADDATVRAVLNSWGPGKFDAELLLDGKAFRPDGQSAATLIPPAFGLAGINMQTWTGWGSVAHWNALVAVLEMGGQGNFYDPRLNDDRKFPIAAANNFGNIRVAADEDRVTAKLPALHLYQLSLTAPRPDEDELDEERVRRGKALFNAKARCSTCHVPPLYTEPGWNLHKADEIGIDAFQAERSPEEAYRTAPLKGLWTHSKGGFYHDGRFASLLAVIDHYNHFFELGLTHEEKQDLQEFLNSL
jgi:hypothetical protein